MTKDLREIKKFLSERGFQLTRDDGRNFVFQRVRDDKTTTLRFPKVFKDHRGLKNWLAYNKKYFG